MISFPIAIYKDGKDTRRLTVVWMQLSKVTSTTDPSNVKSDPEVHSKGLHVLWYIFSRRHFPGRIIRHSVEVTLFHIFTAELLASCIFPPIDKGVQVSKPHLIAQSGNMILDCGSILHRRITPYKSSATRAEPKAGRTMRKNLNVSLITVRKT